MFTTQWNTGDEIWFYTALVSGVICLLLIVIGIVTYFASKDDNTQGTGLATAFISAIVGLVIGGISAFVFFPYNSVYFQYRPVSGLVQATSSRFISDGQASTQNFLVQINGQPYRCDDTRCSDLKVGEPVTLMCEKQWAANGAPGYVCNFGKYGLNGG